MPAKKQGVHLSKARETKLSLSNTTNTAANQPSNANNTPPYVPLSELLTNQNLQNLAASAAALPRLQQINSSSMNANIATSHLEAMDTSHSVSPQVSQPALHIIRHLLLNLDLWIFLNQKRLKTKRSKLYLAILEFMWAK